MTTSPASDLQELRASSNERDDVERAYSYPWNVVHGKVDKHGGSNKTKSKI